MDRVIMIKYGELTTKKGNRKFFINTLYKNINDKLTDEFKYQTYSSYPKMGLCY